MITKCQSAKVFYSFVNKCLTFIEKQEKLSNKMNFDKIILCINIIKELLIFLVIFKKM